MEIRITDPDISVAGPADMTFVRQVCKKSFAYLKKGQMRAAQTFYKRHISWTMIYGKLIVHVSDLSPRPLFSNCKKEIL